MHCAQGGLGDIKKELDSLRSQTSVLDGAAKSRHSAGSGVRQRHLGSSRGDALTDHLRNDTDDFHGRGRIGGASTNKAWSNEDQRRLNDSLTQQMRSREQQQQKGTSWRTVFTATLVFLVIGPFRQLLVQAVKQMLASNANAQDTPPGDDEFEF